MAVESNVRLMLKGRTFMERRFLRLARNTLPLQAVEFEISDWGVLTIRWRSPCPEVGSLWVSIAPGEIVLSCLVSHYHCSRTQLRLEKLTGRELKRRMVDQAVNKVGKFLSGFTSVMISYDSAGRTHSYGWNDVGDIQGSIDYFRGVYGDGYTHRIWNWFGEIEQSNLPKTISLSDFRDMSS